MIDICIQCNILTVIQAHAKSHFVYLLIPLHYSKTFWALYVLSLLLDRISVVLNLKSFESEQARIVVVSVGIYVLVFSLFDWFACCATIDCF